MAQGHTDLKGELQKTASEIKVETANTAGQIIRGIAWVLIYAVVLITGTIVVLDAQNILA